MTADTQAPKPYKFDPDWVVPTGEFVRECMEESGLHPGGFAMACGRMPLRMLEGILAGKVKVTKPVAEGLARGTGVPARMWLSLERIYRAGLKAGKTAL